MCDEILIPICKITYIRCIFLYATTESRENMPSLSWLLIKGENRSSFNRLISWLKPCLCCVYWQLKTMLTYSVKNKILRVKKCFIEDTLIVKWADYFIKLFLIDLSPNIQPYYKLCKVFKRTRSVSFGWCQKIWIAFILHTWFKFWRIECYIFLHIVRQKLNYPVYSLAPMTHSQMLK